MSRRSSPSALEGLIALFNFTLSVAAGLAKLPTEIATAQRRIDAQAVKTRLDAERIEESRLNQQVKAAQVARQNNEVVIRDLDIEIRKLQLLKLQKELGVLAPEFKPENYDN